MRIRSLPGILILVLILLFSVCGCGKEKTVPVTYRQRS